MRNWILIVFVWSIFASAQTQNLPVPPSVLSNHPADVSSRVNANPASRRVMVLVTATDRSGSPASQLAENDLSVIDNDNRGEVITVQPASHLPLRVAFLLLADSPSFAQQQNAAIELSHKILRPNIDRAFVITARGRKPWPSPRLEWQDNPETFEKAVRALDKDAGFSDEFNFDMSTYEAGTNTHVTIFQYGSQASSVFSVLWAMMASDPTPARRVVVMFRDPWAHSAGFGGIYSERVEENHVHLIADAQRLWTSLFVIGIDRPQELSKEFTEIYAPTHAGEGGYNRVYDQNMERARERAYNSGKANLERLSASTGGAIWWNSKKNYTDAVSGIASAMKAQFAVTYAVHSDVGTGPKHVLQIRSANGNVHVAAQNTYFSRQAPTVATQNSVPDLKQPAASSTPTH